MRAWLSPLLILLLVPGWSGEARLPLLGEAAEMRAEPVPLFADAPERRRLGALTYLGGVQLTSPDSAFGGFSAIDVEDDRFLLLSDGGNIVRFRMNDWRVSGARFSNLTAGPRSGWEKRDRDSESLAVDRASGRYWIGFEDANAIWRYDRTLTRASAHARPEAMRRWTRSAGAEAMTRLADGRFLVLSEGARTRRMPRGSYSALLFAGDPTDAGQRGVRFAYRPPSGFRATAIDQLPDGRVVILNRRIAWPEGFSAAVTIADPEAIRAGAVLEGEEVARFPGGLLAGFGRDNFEALAVTREGDATILWIASDDNLSWPQRSLLLKFRLDLPQARPAQTPTTPP